MRVPARLLLPVLLLALAAPAPAQSERDPAGRVARIAYVEGSASFAPAGVQEWAKAILNRPLIAGDRIYTEVGARLELELGASALRLDQRSAAEILDLDDEVAQFFLSEGRANLYVRRIFEGQVYEIATPVGAVVVRSPVSLTVEVPPAGTPLRVAVWHGRAEVVGEGRRIELVGPEELLASDRTLADHHIRRDPAESDFERFAFARDREFDRADALRYVPDDLIGYRELDRYGSWTYVREYGPVWFPSRVSIGWTPYRYGHWAWLPVYGWTWIDEAPWGFAVSHYGRWVWWDGRWGWIPCPRRHRAYWAPALVVFYGGRHWSLSYASAPVGWFPLGPGDVWLPWYSASWHYFHRINVWNTWIGHGIVLDVYNTVYLGGGLVVNLNYRYRGRDFAWTFVPEENFRRGRPVHRHLLPVSREDIARAELRRVLGVLPTQASVKGAAPSARGVPDSGLFAREAVVTRQPATRAGALPFATGEGISPAAERTRGLRLVGDERVGARGGSEASASGVGSPLRSRGGSLTAVEGDSILSRARGDSGAIPAGDGLRRGRLAEEALSPGGGEGAALPRGRAPSPAEISERRAGALGESRAWQGESGTSFRRGSSTALEGLPAGGRRSERAAVRGDLGADPALGESPGRERLRTRALEAPDREADPSSGASSRLGPRGEGRGRVDGSAAAPSARSWPSESPRAPAFGGSGGHGSGSLVPRPPANREAFRSERDDRPAATRPVVGGWPRGDNGRSASRVAPREPLSATRGGIGEEASGGWREPRGSRSGFAPGATPRASSAPPGRIGGIDLAPRGEYGDRGTTRGGWMQPPERSFRSEPPATRSGWESSGSFSRGSLDRGVEPSTPPRAERSPEPARSESPVRESRRGWRDEER